METVNSDQVSLDINTLAKSVGEELKILRPFSDKCSIYRVPKELRNLNESAYTPQLVSIGPLHLGKEELKEMQDHKRMFLRDFLVLSAVSIQEFIAAIAESETRLRNRYAETFENLSSKDFVKMILLDCSFVIMVLLKNRTFHVERSSDHILNNPRMKRGIIYDMCLLENQLPFFILGDLLMLSKIGQPREHSIIELTKEFLSLVYNFWVPEDILEQINSSKVEHFVDFLRICQQPMELEQPKCLETLSTPSTVELRKAGVKIKLGYGRKLLHITFDKNTATLKIPQLMINDRTEQLFRNIYAFEQCHNSICDKFISQYFTFINWLVYSTKDVEMLVQKGIIVNWICDNDVVLNILHNLDKENVVEFNKNFYFSGVITDLNIYWMIRSHSWKAALKHKYLHDPWTQISVKAAGILLVLTIIQTVCSIIQVV